MKLLILGGTVFLGRHIVHDALARGHELTLFNRARSQPDLFPEVERLQGSRDGGLEVLRGRQWDAVIDTSGYLPRVVGDSARLLADAVEHYAFVSSVSVYQLSAARGVSESAPVMLRPEAPGEQITGETYGRLKLLCEQAAEEALPGRALCVRPGLIVGPHDPSDRFTYWPRRVAAGGDVLAPGDPDAPVQFIDARDLAAWMVTMAEQRQAGVYNATGPAAPLAMETLLELCQQVSRSNARFTFASEDFLRQRGVIPYIEMPLWVPAEGAGMNGIDCTKALSAGLAFRPTAETIRDTLEWDRANPEAAKARCGLAAEREEALLDAWRGRR